MWIIYVRFQEIRNLITSSAFYDVGVKVLRLGQIFLNPRVMKLKQQWPRLNLKVSQNLDLNVSQNAIPDVYQNDLYLLSCITHKMFLSAQP